MGCIRFKRKIRKDQGGLGPSMVTITAPCEQMRRDMTLRKSSPTIHKLAQVVIMIHAVTSLSDSSCNDMEMSKFIACG